MPNTHPRHCTTVDLLRAQGMTSEAAERDAEGMECPASATTLTAFKAFLAARS